MYFVALLKYYLDDHVVEVCERINNRPFMPRFVLLTLSQSEKRKKENAHTQNALLASSRSSISFSQLSGIQIFSFKVPNYKNLNRTANSFVYSSKEEKPISSFIFHNLSSRYRFNTYSVTIKYKRKMYSKLLFIEKYYIKSQSRLLSYRLTYSACSASRITLPLLYIN